MSKKLSKRQKQKLTVGRLAVVVLIILLLSILVPALGAGPNAPQLWIDTVGFFQSVQDHFYQFWMFYTFGVALVTYILKK